MIEKKLKALIVPVSANPKSIVPEWLINNRRPECVYFLFSDKSVEPLRRVVKNINSEIKNNIEFHPTLENIVNSNIDDAEKIDFSSMEICKKSTLSAINKLREKYKDGEIFVELSPGMVPTSLGMFQAAEEESINTIYTKRKDDGFIKEEELNNPKAAEIRYISKHY
jgi:hypothetical protein